MPRGAPTGSPSNTSSPSSGSIRCSNRRASVDFPQPLSPTMPSVSPLNNVNDTPSTARTTAPFGPAFTGKCRFKSRTIINGWAGPPRSRLSSVTGGTSDSMFIASHPHIHGRANPVADQIKADRCDKNRRPGQRTDQRIDVDRLPQRAQHQSPVGRGRLHPEAEEGQTGREQNPNTDKA